jgi:DMSO/TMAO reductase YedYZ molybdopterin-dependent catalytic subunit
MKMKNKLIQIFIITSIIELLMLLNPTPLVLADASFNLEVTNLVGTNFSFTYEQLLAMPKTVVNAYLLCYGSFVTSGNWSGVLLSHLLNLIQVPPEVSSIKFVASDGYNVIIPIELAMQPQIIIAYEKDNESLHEGLRLILPEYNGEAWIAMITSISMSISGAEYPAGINIGDSATPRLPTPNGKTPSPIQGQATIPPQQTTPENSPGNQTRTPANVSNPNQPTSTPQLTNNEDSGIQIVFLYSIISALVIVLAVLCGLAYRGKKGSLKTS